jgi:PAS domain S-box-containing protein
VPGSAITHEHVGRMLDEIHEHYAQRLTLATLANTLERQSSYLGRLFRDEVGVTVHEYVTRARMMFGASQIRSGVKIEAVALELGYRSKKNFYRQFRRRFGMTPYTYRHDQGEAAGNDSVAPAPRHTHKGGRASAFGVATSSGRSRQRQEQRRVDPTAAARVTSLARQRVVRALVDSPVAMLVTDAEGCYVGANKTAVSITGYSVEELRGMSAEVLLPTRSESDTKSRLQILLPASSSLPCNAVLLTKSARSVHVRLTSVENIL